MAVTPRDAPHYHPRTSRPLTQGYWQCRNIELSIWSYFKKHLTDTFKTSSKTHLNKTTSNTLPNHHHQENCTWISYNFNYPPPPRPSTRFVSYPIRKFLVKPLTLQWYDLFMSTLKYMCSFKSTQAFLWYETFKSLRGETSIETTVCKFNFLVKMFLMLQYNNAHTL